MSRSWRPLLTDAHGSGLYEADDGARAWRDMEHPEDRWIRTMAEDAEREAEAMERERDLEIARTTERDRWADEDDEWPWRKRERPAGLMYGLEDHDAV